jgi:hypothetical protein
MCIELNVGKMFKKIANMQGNLLWNLAYIQAQDSSNFTTEINYYS